ncbi:unnamed protein product [Pieris macdunnoughi]|uniref:Uncharacterized protein n=1 Tax=Pieris macdunnoughi TaxID=345717 RepID=A0A821S211_9NEOP|nr:unnamed protein product [Pieris macdunnoughi]
MLLQQATPSPGPSGTASPKSRQNPNFSRLNSPVLSDGKGSLRLGSNSPSIGTSSPKFGYLGDSPNLGASPKYGSPKLGGSPKALEDEAALERLQTDLKEGWTVHTGRDGRLYYCK